MNYKRLTITISPEASDKLDKIVENRRVSSINKSSIVGMALMKFFDSQDGRLLLGEETEFKDYIKEGDD